VPVEEQEKMDTSSDSEKSNTSEESEARSNTSSSPVAQGGLSEVECTTIHECLENIGESPLKPPSKITPTYASNPSNQHLKKTTKRCTSRQTVRGKIQKVINQYL
jgi:hypothetical protein